MNYKSSTRTADSQVRRNRPVRWNFRVPQFENRWTGRFDRERRAKRLLQDVYLRIRNRVFG